MQDNDKLFFVIKGNMCYVIYVFTNKRIPIEMVTIVEVDESEFYRFIEDAHKGEQITSRYEDKFYRVYYSGNKEIAFKDMYGSNFYLFEN